MGYGNVCLLNDERYRAIEGSSRPPLINLTVPRPVRAGRGAADHDRVVVSTGRPIRGPRSDDQEGEGARTATVDEGVW